MTSKQPNTKGEDESRTKRELLTRSQYEAARVLARIVGGGYGGTYRGYINGVHHGYYLTVADDERARLRERLLDLARRLDIDPRPIIRPPRFARFDPNAEWPVWPHELFVACVKLLNQRRREGRPDEQAEQAAGDLIADAKRHDDASRAYRPPTHERSRGTTGATTKADDVSELRRRLDQLTDITDEGARFRLLREIHDRAGRAGDDEWPDWIPG